MLHNHGQHFTEAKANKSIEYFLAGPTYDSNQRKNAESTHQIYKDLDAVCNGVGYFEGTFSLQLKPDSKPYQAPSRHMAYVLQRPFQEELERLQQQV